MKNTTNKNTTTPAAFVLTETQKTALASAPVMVTDPFMLAGQTLTMLAGQYGMTCTTAKKAVRVYTAVYDAKGKAHKVPVMVAWRRADGVRVYVSTENFQMTDELGRHTEKLTNSCSESVSFDTSVWLNGADEVTRLLPFMFKYSVWGDCSPDAIGARFTVSE